VGEAERRQQEDERWRTDAISIRPHQFFAYEHDA